jgi:YHS domain-containing protein
MSPIAGMVSSLMPAQEIQKGDNMQTKMKFKTMKDKNGKKYWFISSHLIHAFRIEETNNNSLVVVVYEKKDNRCDFHKKVFLTKVFDDGTFKLFGLKCCFKGDSLEGVLTITLPPIDESIDPDEPIF